MGAPLGNRNGVKAKPWTDAIRRAIARYDAKSKEDGAYLNKLADQLLTDCINGERDALIELTTRLDGKPANTTELSGPDGGNIPVGVKLIFE